MSKMHFLSLVCEKGTDHSFPLILAPFAHPLVILFPGFTRPIWPPSLRYILPVHIWFRPTKLQSKEKYFLKFSLKHLQGKEF